MSKQRSSRPRRRLLAALPWLNLWWLAVAFVVLAVVVSMAIVLVIDLAWDGRLNPELEFAGVVTPVLDAALVMAIITLILAELRTEAARRERTEEVLKEAQHIAHIGTWTLDLSTGQLNWSEELFRIFEANAAELSPSYEALLQRVQPADRDKVDAAHRRSLASGDSFELSFRLQLASGHLKHVSERGATLRDARGKALWAIGTLQDITARVNMEEELRRLATTDALTGVANRHRFNELLGQELERSRRYRMPLSLIMFDIDHFKTVNDTHGHDAGDQVLVHLAAVVGGALRRSDVLARWGGEEFMVLAPHTNGVEAANLAERLRTLVAQSPSGTIAITISLGVTTCDAGNASINDLLRGADQMLYRAKTSGRNRTEATVVPAA